MTLDHCWICGGPPSWRYTMQSEPSADYRFAATVAVCGPCHDQIEDGAIDAVTARVREGRPFESRNAKRRMRRTVLAFIDARQGLPEAL